jgi:hypothetical protein
MQIISGLLKSNDTDIFRGQGKSHTEWPLVPKALRVPYKGGDHYEAIDRFRRECPLAGFEPQNNLADLAVAQHYGLATYLLDWSTNPLVALFFASSEQPDSEGEVYVMNKQEPVSEEVENERDTWKEINGLRLYNPPLVDERMARQKGLFTIQAKDERPVNEIVKKNEFTVIPIAADLKKDLTEVLYTMGIDRSTLFPGLGGLCDRINWETANRITRNFPPVSKARRVYIELQAISPTSVVFTPRISQEKKRKKKKAKK